MEDRISAEIDETPRIERVIRDKTEGPKGEAKFVQITIGDRKYWVPAWKVEE